MTEDEMLGWHHRLHGSEFEQAPRGGEGQGSLVCCSPWGRRVGHNCVTEQQHLYIHFFDPAVWLVGSSFPSQGWNSESTVKHCLNHWTDREFPFVYTIYLLSCICGIFSDMILLIHLCQLCLLSL